MPNPGQIDLRGIFFLYEFLFFKQLHLEIQSWVKLTRLFLVVEIWGRFWRALDVFLRIHPSKK